MINFKNMHRLLNIPYVGGEFFKLGMVTNGLDYISGLNEVFSLLLKFTSLVSFGVFILLNYPRIKVRIAQITRGNKKSKNANNRKD